MRWQAVEFGELFTYFVPGYDPNYCDGWRKWGKWVRRSATEV